MKEQAKKKKNQSKEILIYVHMYSQVYEVKICEWKINCNDKNWKIPWSLFC
jgi:hypothetical protein